MLSFEFARMFNETDDLILYRNLIKVVFFPFLQMLEIEISGDTYATMCAYFRGLKITYFCTDIEKLKKIITLWNILQWSWNLVEFL